MALRSRSLNHLARTALAAVFVVGVSASPQLLTAESPAVAQDSAKAPAEFRVRLQTTKGDIVIEVRRDWAPHGADRFYELVRAGYYDDVAFSRVRANMWAQFGINGDPRVSTAWRKRTIPDDPFKESNVRGTVAFAFAVPNGRTTQVFINLADNHLTHDREPFVPFGRVIEGMDIVDSLYSGYGEEAGSGIRSGKQGPLFEHGNAYLRKQFPLLDYITRATIAPSPRP
jgi:cyclophilin family peptidyl-prolyl cis-trans isomerase